MVSVRRVPVLVGLVVLLGHVALLYRAAVSHTDGTFCYPLDDTFIHMAIARTIAQHGIFGVTAQGFASASSSVLWPLVLAVVDRVAGDHLLTPLVLNVTVGCALVVLFDRWIVRSAPKATVAQRTLAVAAMVALAPLPTLVIIGMEHTVHVLASVMLVAAGARLVSSEKDGEPLLPVLAWACVTTGFRYESLFLAGAIAALLVFRRRFRAGAAVLAASALPVVAFGLYSVAHHATFLPTSVLLKGSKLRIDDISDVGDLLGGNLFSRMATEPHMLAAPLVGAFVLVLAIRKNGMWSRHAVTLGIIEIATIGHVELASLNWFFRYEAYLVVLLLGAVAAFVFDEGPTIKDWILGRWGGGWATAATGLAAVLALGMLVRRTIHAAQETPSACRNIYDQQVQNARFLRAYFPNEPVAVNDIGAVAYFGGMPIVDLAGLSTTSMARAKHYEMSRPPLASDVAAETRDTRVAIVYDAWVPYRPHTWTLLGRWRIAGCASCFAPVVNVFATRPDAIPAVTAALRAFAPSLPADVSQEGLYTGTVAHADPNAPDFTLDTDDVVRIHIPGLGQDDPVEQLDDGGRVMLPFVKGAFLARGRTPAALAEAIEGVYRGNAAVKLGDERIQVTLVEKRWGEFARAGNVLRPGVFWSREAPTLAEVIATAALAPQAATGAAPYVFRRNERDEYVRAQPPLDDRLEPLDVVVVP